MSGVCAVCGSVTGRPCCSTWTPRIKLPWSSWTCRFFRFSVIRPIVSANSASGVLLCSSSCGWAATRVSAGSGRWPWSSPKLTCECRVPSSLSASQGKKAGGGSSWSTASSGARWVSCCPVAPVDPAAGGAPLPSAPPWLPPCPLRRFISRAARWRRVMCGRPAPAGACSVAGWALPGCAAGTILPSRRRARSRSEGFGGSGTAPARLSRRAYCSSRSILSASALVRSPRLVRNQPTERFSPVCGGFSRSLPAFFRDFSSNPTANYRKKPGVNLCQLFSWFSSRLMRSLACSADNPSCLSICS